MKWLNLLLTRVATAMPSGFWSFVKKWVLQCKMYILGGVVLILFVLYMLKGKKREQVHQPIEKAQARSESAEKKVNEYLKKAISYEIKKDSLHRAIDKLDGDDLQSTVDSVFNR